MAVASGSQHSMYYVPEVTIGTTPATPVFKTFRHTGTSLGLSKGTLESNELGGRTVKCFRHGNKSVGGGSDFELGYGDYDDFLEAALGGTWAADTPIAGTDQLKSGNTRRGFTIERYFEDIAKRIRYEGCEVDEVSLSITAGDSGDIITGSVTLMGVDQDPLNTIVAGATYTAATSQCPFTSFEAGITEGGASIAIVTGLDLTISNSLATSFVLGSSVTGAKSIGKLRISGTMTVQFTDVTLMNKFINETGSSLEIALTAIDTSVLNIELPNIKYNGGQPDVSGDGEISLSMPFVALYDATALAEIVIERTPV